ncbi:M23 family metallopeptidase [Cohnella caldifontis]|uniref:M23 family metallopeptidase n=1 Tax=Cohnella caldifontis TaxID=3027471 RepID=UPI0023EE06A8|nr:M23 family metallopeptidase [Cohnella sp. YIM B05605]
MKFLKWNRQKFTFMVIPDANSQVVRFRLSSGWLFGALIAVAIVTISAAVALVLYGDRKTEVARLKHQLADATGKYEQIISDKDRHIGDLQTEVADLSDQAKSIQDKMADIGKLETQLKQIAGLEKPSSGSAGSGEGTAAESEGYAMDGGTGGEELPVTDGEIADMVEETRQNFADLGQWIEEMKPRLEETKDAVLKQQKKLMATPTIWPVDSRKITSTFGVRKDPFTHRARFHAGIDISGDTGDPVYATADGVVSHTGRDGDHGNNILVSHGNGLTTHYSHLSKILVKPGAKVRKGEIIGEMGSTGRSTGPHLHYEVYVKGTHVDPKPYLQTDRKDD